MDRGESFEARGEVAIAQPQESTFANPVDRLNAEGPRASFGRWAKLKVPGGRDQWSAKRLPQLLEIAGNDAIAEIDRVWMERCEADGEEKAFPDKEKASCLRWHLRGLNPDCAVRKVRVDREVNRNAIGK